LNLHVGKSEAQNKMLVWHLLIKLNLANLSAYTVIGHNVPKKQTQLIPERASKTNATYHMDAYHEYIIGNQY